MTSWTSRRDPLGREARSGWSGTRRGVDRSADRGDGAAGEDGLDDGGRDGRGRRIATTVALPTGRAIAGGLLVAIAALGIFAAHRAATARELRSWVVVDRAVPAGTVIEASDLVLAPMELHAITTRRAVADPDRVIGRVALVQLERGDLVTDGLTAESGHGGPGRRLGLSLGSAAALGGDLSPGDRVDVVALPDGDQPSAVVVRGALVSDLEAAEDGIGSGADLRVNLVVADEESARRVLDAHSRGGVSLIAATAIRLDTGDR